MQVTSVENTNFQGNVVLKRRSEKKHIQKYLNETLSLLRPMEYYVHNAFDETKLFDAFNRNLPGDSHEIGRLDFIKDIIHLAESFFSLSTSKYIRIQLEIVRTDMCRLFHVDNMRQRLLCTYIGPGTEWLSHSNVLRDGLGKGCNHCIVKDFKKINHARPFEVLILKGLKSAPDELPVVHRSPEIEKDAKTRVLLKIDECQKGKKYV